MQTLKPCPFCGGKASIERKGDRRMSTIYSCDWCGCSLETGEEWDHGKTWNTRPAPAATDTGLETVETQWRCAFIPNDKWVSSKQPENMRDGAIETRELVTRSQAEELLAAERAEKDGWKELHDAAQVAVKERTEACNSLYRQNTDLEAKLAAANEVAQLVIQAEEDKSGDPNFYILLMQTAYDKARAVLGGKPS